MFIGCDLNPIDVDELNQEGLDIAYGDKCLHIPAKKIIDFILREARDQALLMRKLDQAITNTKEPI